MHDFSDSVHTVIGLVNHEAWFEPEGERVYVKWGHYPKTDGKMDFCLVKRVIVDGKEGVVGIDKDSSSRNALFLEPTPTKYALVEYDKGKLYKLKGGRWVPKPLEGHDVEKEVVIRGRAVVYLAEPEPLGEGLELVPSSLPGLCEEVEVSVLEDGKPAEAEVSVHYPDGVLNVGKVSKFKVVARTKIVVVKAVIEKDGERKVATLTLVGA